MTYLWVSMVKVPSPLVCSRPKWQQMSFIWSCDRPVSVVRKRLFFYFCEDQNSSQWHADIHDNMVESFFSFVSHKPKWQQVSCICACDKPVSVVKITFSEDQVKTENLHTHKNTHKKANKYFTHAHTHTCLFLICQHNIWGHWAPHHHQKDDTLYSQHLTKRSFINQRGLIPTMLDWFHTYKTQQKSVVTCYNYHQLCKNWKKVCELHQGHILPNDASWWHILI